MGWLVWCIVCFAAQFDLYVWTLGTLCFFIGMLTRVTLRAAMES